MCMINSIINIFNLQYSVKKAKKTKQGTVVSAMETIVAREEIILYIILIILIIIRDYFNNHRKMARMAKTVTNLTYKYC